MKMLKSNLGLISISILIVLLLLEVIFSLTFKKKDNNYNLAQERYMLFEQGDVFKNVDNFFKYYSNKKILSKTFYKLENNFIEEYSYEITTNNFGLVQDNNILKNKVSILFLGDSFIEGQGSTPWVNNFNGNFNQYQIINGGISGTGPQQFELMEKHISEVFNIEKVFLFYIGDDLRRDIFKMPDNTINCLKNSNNCVGDENFYGFPIRDKNPEEFLIYLSNYRYESKKNSPKFNKFRRKIKKKISDLYIFKIPLNYLRQEFYKSKNIKIKKNFESLKRLNDKYYNNIFYIQIRNKNEIINGKEYETLYAENFIKKI